MNKYFSDRKKSFGYAFEGIYALFKNEAHAKIHLVAAVLVIITGIILNLTATEWCFIFFAIGGVFMAEGFNTAIEKVCDRVSPEKHPLIKAAKDIAAGSVLLFVFSAVAVGLIIFVPKIISLF